MTHELIPLGYEYNALEPEMDAETVEIHYSKHHQGYVDKLNKSIEKYPELADKSLEWLLENLESLSKEIKQAVINAAGGVYNHNFFWSIITKDSPFKKDSEIGKKIISKFESFENFKLQFSNSASTLFGSGWTWLVLNNNELEIIQTENQESPISKGMTPLITIDVWEHTYYLKYRNKRPDFIENFFNIINWEKVNELFVKEKQ